MWPNPDTTDVDKLLADAEAAGVDIRFGDDGYKIKATANRKTPETKAIFDRLGKAVAQNRKAVQFALRKKGYPALFNPTTPFSVAKHLLPDTMGGKAAVGALTALDFIQPEAGLPLQALVGTLAGGAGGLLGGEGAVPGAETGLISGLTNVAGQKAVKGAKYLGKFIKRPSMLDRLDMANIGKVVKDYLKDIVPVAAEKIATDPNEFATRGAYKVLPKKAGEPTTIETAPLRNTVIRVLNSPQANQELEQAYRQTIDNTVKEIKNKADQDVLDFRKAFKAKFGYEITQRRPKGVQANKAALKALQQYKLVKERASTIVGDMYKAFDDIGGLGRAAYDTEGELKHSYSAWRGVKTKRDLLDKVDDEMKIADPTGNLSNELERMRDGYAKFKGFQDFVNMDGALDEHGHWFKTRVLQKGLDEQTNPAIRFIQRRLKDAFEPLVDTVRRGSEQFVEKGSIMRRPGEPLVSDILPLENFKLRTAESVPGLKGRIFSHIPVPRQFTSYLGDAAKVPPQAAGKLPVLLNSLITKGTEQGEPVETTPEE